MERIQSRIIYFCLAGLFCVTTLSAQTPASNPSPLDNISFSGQWFLAYDYEDEDGVTTNEFILKRGYVTISKTFSKNLSARITQDITVDQEGDGAGDIEIRLKYGYIRYMIEKLGFLHKPLVEFGLVHRPWIDFEQKINPYRVQGTMFLERYGVLRSADYGVTVITLFGEPLPKGDVKRAYPGRYGSAAFGVYNGGGYEKLENNENKLVEGRVSLRPLPDIVPGFQVSYAGAFGKGNSAQSPEYNFNAGFLSWEHRQFTATATYYMGTGDLQGNDLEEATEPYDRHGYSLFSEVRLFQSPFRLMGRYDNFTVEKASAITSERYIGGLVYYFYDNSKVMVDYDYAERGSSKATMIEFVIEINY